jgi:ElaA protein
MITDFKNKTAVLTRAGCALKLQALDSMSTQRGMPPICIGTRVRLETFDEQHGFTLTSAPYIEEGIPHLRGTARVVK